MANDESTYFKWRLTLIMLLALLLRVGGIGFGLPFTFHQDEPILVNHALSLGVTGGNTHFFVLPPLGIYFLFFLYGGLYLAMQAIGFVDGINNFAIFFLKDPTWFYLLGRLGLGVFPAMLNVYAVGVIGKKLYSNSTGLLAAFFLALCSIHVQQSHYIYVDILLALLSTLFWYRAISCIERPSLRRFMQLGAILGLGTAVKYTMFYFGPLFLLVLLATRKKTLTSRSAWSYLVAAGATALLVFSLCAPYTFLDWANFYFQIKRQSGAQGYTGLVHHFYYSLGQGMGFFLLFLALMGFIQSKTVRDIKGYRTASLILLTGLYATSTFFGQTASRYALPMVPIFCLFAASGWQYLKSTFFAKQSNLARIIFVAGVMLTLAPTIYADYLFLKTDTRAMAYAWIKDTIPKESGIAVDNRFYAPPLSQTAKEWQEKEKMLSVDAREAVRKKRIELMLLALPEKTYRVYTLFFKAEDPNDSFLITKPRIALDFEELKKEGVQYLIVNGMEYHPEIGRWLAQNKQAVLLASFSPYWDPEKKINADPSSTTAAPHAWKELFSRERLGPYLQIYGLGNHDES